MCMKCDEDKGHRKPRQGWQQFRFEWMKPGAVLKYSLRMRIGMGLDGGGTKTDCVLMDDAGRILGRGRGSASNPSRIGTALAVRGVMEAATSALSGVGLRMDEVFGVCAGLAGVALAERAAAMNGHLRGLFGPAQFELCTDLDLALSATGAAPSIALVVGTGTAAIGRDGAGRVARSGGHGPKQSDEGSAFAIGKRAVFDSAKANHASAAELGRQILKHLGASSLESIAGLEGTEADAVYPRIFPIVAAAADEGNELAKTILRESAQSLAGFVADVQRQLHPLASEFVLGKTGGMIGRSNFFDETLDAELRRVAPLARLENLQTPLAEVAARRALSL